MMHVGIVTDDAPLKSQSARCESTVNEPQAIRSKDVTTEPLEDDGQTLTGPEGKVIGFLEAKDEVAAFTEALSAAGYPPAAITLLYGEDGIHLLERLKEHSFFFADSEDSIIELGVRQLRLGHYAIAIDVSDRKQAVEIGSLAKPHGGHGFTYFGTWVTEQLPM